MAIALAALPRCRKRGATELLHSTVPQTLAPVVSIWQASVNIDTLPSATNRARRK